MGIGVDSQVQMKSGCEKMFLPSLKTSAFFSIDEIRWYVYVIAHTSWSENIKSKFQKTNEIFFQICHIEARAERGKHSVRFLEDVIMR